MFTEYIYILIAIIVVLALSFLPQNNYLLLLEVLILLPLVPTLLTLRTAPFVPSKKDKIDTMFKLAAILKDENVYDLGAGDGRMVSRAATLGANATGIEVSVPMFIYFQARKALGKVKGNMIWGDIWRRDYSDANVILIFVMPAAMKRFEDQVYPKLSKGTRVVSNAFILPNVKPNKQENGVYLYIK